MACITMLKITQDKLPRLKKSKKKIQVHRLFNLTARCVKWYQVVVSEFYQYLSTVPGPSPRIAFGVGDGFGASLPAGHVLKIALVTMESKLL